ncbi:MAG: hypothetical protein WBB15_12365, partial [Ornithinimicrobium sp.]
MPRSLRWIRWAGCPAQVREAGEHHGQDVGQAGPAGALAGERVELDEVLGDQLDQCPVEVVGVDVVDEALQKSSGSCWTVDLVVVAVMMVCFFRWKALCTGWSWGSGWRITPVAGAGKSPGLGADEVECVRLDPLAALALAERA